MAASHETISFDVHDFKVYSLLTDSTAASPTYGSAVDIPGIAEVSLEPNLVTAELKGDARIIAKRGRTDRFKVKATYGKISLDALAVVFGGSTTDPQTTEARWALSSPAPLPYFKAEFKIDDLDTGLASLHVQLFKAQLTGGTLLTNSSDNFGKPTLELEAIQPDHAATDMGRIKLFTVATDLSA